MKIMSTMFVVILLVVMAACTPGSSESGTEPAVEAPENTPALDTVQPDELLAPTVTAVPTEAYPVSVPAESEVVTGEAYPGQVDLSQLTPQPPEEAYPIVAPQPGVPNQGTAVAHLVSQDLAQRLNIDISAVTTVSVEAKEWPDSALGCSATDMVYTAVITPGYQIILEANGKTYAYHTNTQNKYVLCGEDGHPVIP